MITKSTRDVLTSETILQKMKDVQQGKPWYGTSVDDLISRVEPNFAFATVPGAHSIASILAHMIYWKQYTLCVLEKEKCIRDQQESFSWSKFGKASPNTWHHMIETHRELNNRIMDYLDNEVIDPYAEVQDARYNMRTLLEGIVEHDIYHIGQIALMTKFHQAKNKGNSLFKYVKGFAIW